MVADLVGDAPVVKAANTLAAAVLGTDPREAGGQRVLFLSGDDRDPRMRPRVSADRSISPNGCVVSPDESDQRWRAPLLACADVALLHALLDAAGEDLNYGTLDTGADGLTVKLPGDPTPRRYGPPPASDGDPRAYLYEWEPDMNAFLT